jgi:ubiquinone/menaquinone biosynthesis C-methylase UbiE
MAKKAFDHCADAYARYRPGYPREVFDALAASAGSPAGRWLADVGAGTGIFTHALAECGWRVAAIDPSIGMLSEARRREAASGPVSFIAGEAERLPLADGSVAAVTCAQSFHWFNPPVALAEFARVLAERGTLLLTWNNRDRTDPFVVAFEKLIQRWNPAYRQEYRDQDWAAKVAASRRFTPLTCTRVRWSWRMPQEAFVGFTRSLSYLRNVLPSASIPLFEADLRAVLQQHFGSASCVVPMHTVAWLAQKV